MLMMPRNGVPALKPGETDGDLFPGQRVCFGCGLEQATGFWLGDEKDASVCTECAVEILPKLIADALVAQLGRDGQDAIPHLRRNLDRIHARFWEAAAVAISKTNRRP